MSKMESQQNLVDTIPIANFVTWIPNIDISHNLLSKINNERQVWQLCWRWNKMHHIHYGGHL
jgi:hypothetical protein